jgi:putative RNA 2'-phosphotransferase
MDVNQSSPEQPQPELDEARADRLSRFLAMVLRHRAHQFDLPVDDEGFVPIDDLLDVIEEQSSLDWVELEHLEFLTRRGDRKRFEIRNGGMRATYGHSFRRPVRYEEVDPPEHLYVAIPKAQISQVKVQGLRPVGRQYVHLSEERSEAEEVGRRHDDNSMIVTVRAGEAAGKGVPFYRPTDGLYLVSHLPAQYLELQTSYGRKPRKGRRR